MSGIDVLPSADQEQIAEAVARTLADLFPIQRLDHGRAPATLSPDDWRMIADLGWTAMALPGDAGGEGYDLTDAVLLHRLYARHLVTPCLAATTIAAKLAAEAGKMSLAQALAGGREHAAFAIVRDGAAGGCHLIDADGASVLVLLAEDGARLLERGAVSGEQSIDPLEATLPLARAQLASGAATSPADPSAGLWALALIASELSGLAAAASAMATEYAKIRQQFGKPIGAFQAIAHACASAAMRAEAAIAQSNFAAIAVRDGWPDAAVQAAAACLIASDAAFQNATANIQVHGGMGFSAESDAHLYLKRAILLRTLAGGDAAQSRRLMAGEVLEPAS